jgi:hypothetical protein
MPDSMMNDCLVWPAAATLSSRGFVPPSTSVHPSADFLKAYLDKEYSGSFDHFQDFKVARAFKRSMKVSILSLSTRTRFCKPHMSV